MESKGNIATDRLAAAERLVHAAHIDKDCVSEGSVNESGVNEGGGCHNISAEYALSAICG
jgi:hypothetical protein